MSFPSQTIPTSAQSFAPTSACTRSATTVTLSAVPLTFSHCVDTIPIVSWVPTDSPRKIVTHAQSFSGFGDNALVRSQMCEASLIGILCRLLRQVTWHVVEAYQDFFGSSSVSSISGFETIGMLRIQIVVGRVEEYLDRDIDDPELDLQYPSTDPPAFSTIDATLETFMRVSCLSCDLTFEVSSSGLYDSPMSIDFFSHDVAQQGLALDNRFAFFGRDRTLFGRLGCLNSTSRFNNVEPVESEVRRSIRCLLFHRPKPFLGVTLFVDDSGFNWGNLSRYHFARSPRVLY
ncbi:hypothetical protein K435DRAFT_812411 [Dendrothele bispora CBS 962.96]|uniref:Uncharacterized protein n=1 Tax=Dendrothele bispora (strain CBS 962.96) TaxID=1314807 RepID=A0A4S8KPF1_DENBC|nr:hypothetical protein K435DRAFT_812411 [Dendrothele bispora CBS 962.96]